MPDKLNGSHKKPSIPSTTPFLQRWLRSLPLYHQLASSTILRRLFGKGGQRYGFFIILLLGFTWLTLHNREFDQVDLVDVDDDASSLDFVLTEEKKSWERDFWTEKPSSPPPPPSRKLLEDDGLLDVLYMQILPAVAETLSIPNEYFNNLWNRNTIQARPKPRPWYEAIPHAVVSLFKALLQFCVWPAKFLLKSILYLILLVFKLVLYPLRFILHLVGLADSPNLTTNVDAYTETVLGWRAQVKTAGTNIWSNLRWKSTHSDTFSLDDNAMALGILPEGMHLGVGPVNIVEDARQMSKPHHLLLDRTRDMAKHAWQSYHRSARGCDELAPITSGCRNWYHAEHSILLTPHESLDTLYLLGLFSEFRQAKSLVMDVEWFDLDMDVEVKELIRACLAGLLSGYVVSSDVQLLEKAVELGSRLLVAFSVVGPDATPEFPSQSYYLPHKAFPSPFVNLKKGTASNPFDELPLSDVLDFQSEFETLSRLTGDPRWSKAVKRVEKWLWVLGQGVGPIKLPHQPGDLRIGKGFLPHSPGLWPNALVLDTSPQAKIRRNQDTSVPVLKSNAKPDPLYAEWVPKTPFVVPKYYGVKDWSLSTYSSICRRGVSDPDKMSMLCQDIIKNIFKLLGVQDYQPESPMAPFTSSFSPASSTAALLRDMIRDPEVKADVAKQILEGLTKTDDDDELGKKSEAEIVKEMAERTDIGQLTKRSMRINRFPTRFAPPDFPLMFQDQVDKQVSDDMNIRRDWELDGDNGLDQAVCSLMSTLAHFFASKRHKLISSNVTDGDIMLMKWRESWGWIEGTVELCARVWVESDFGIAPKEADVSDNHPRATTESIAARNALYYSTLDSLYHMHVITLNPSYRAWAGQILEALNVFTRIPGRDQREKLVSVDGGGIGGYSGVENVMGPDHYTRENDFNLATKITAPLTYTDHQPSYFLGGTVKYLALTFAGLDGDGLHVKDMIRGNHGQKLRLSLDDFVFNSRGHPLPLYPRRAKIDVTKIITRLRERENGKRGGNDEW